MQALENVVPELFGGAADLTTSTKTIFKDSPSFHVDPKGRNVFFGVREFGMMAMVNGMAAHGGLIPYGSTFFVFSDYCRSALRMAALMSVHSLFVFTHDSIGLGADGPTHQPVEHLMSLRAIPQLTDFRPADANETAACWQLALERKSASFMALSRQDLPVLDAKIAQAGPRKGAYELSSNGKDIILIATGSEVSVIVKAAEELKTAGINATVVSMPSFKIFDEQDAAYKASLFPENTPKLAIEAGATLGWYKYVGHNGAVIGLDRFGASAPGRYCAREAGHQRSECSRACEEAAEEVIEFSNSDWKPMTQDEAKRMAARRALEFVEDGMLLGLGSGTTSAIFIQELGVRVKQGLRVRGIATSIASQRLAESLSIPITNFEESPELDLAIDGADEVGPGLALIKGGGGALLREKIVESAARRFIVIADSSKLVDQLGRFPLAG